MRTKLSRTERLLIITSIVGGSVSGVVAAMASMIIGALPHF